MSLDYFPIEPNLARPPGDDVALSEFFEVAVQDAGAAVVEVRWIMDGDGIPLVRSIVKARPEGGPLVYVGSLIVPFATCSWVAKVQSLEVGVTGMREALWFDQHLAAGGTPEDAFASGEPPSSPGAHPGVRRLPSDDEVWDDIVPNHPLSRVRRLLPQLAASIEISPAAQRLSPFH